MHNIVFVHVYKTLLIVNEYIIKDLLMFIRHCSHFKPLRHKMPL